MEESELKIAETEIGVIASSMCRQKGAACSSCKERERAFGCEIYKDAVCLYCFGADCGDRADIEDMFTVLRKSKSDHAARLFRYLDAEIGKLFAKLTIDRGDNRNDAVIREFLSNVEQLKSTFILQNADEVPNGA